MRIAKGIMAVAAVLAMPDVAFAAEAHGLPGGTMPLLWAIPFAGILLSIATGPLFFAHFWEHHYGKIAGFWAALVIVPLIIGFGFGEALYAVLHTMLLEYMSFIILLFALFTISGGILISGNIHGTPLVNTSMLLIGALLASVVGTTGASMILIRPIIRANDDRRHNVHVIVFFIFLVSNIGGSLTPLGDPPLFLGFLRGVDFFWTTTHMALPAAFVGGLVLAIFFLLDTYLHRREDARPPLPDPTPDSRIRLRGLANLPLLGGVIAAILMSGIWRPEIYFTVHGVELALQNLLRDVIIVALALTSLVISRKEYREANGFNWEPILEVAKLFAGIFICIIPVIAILQAGLDGAFAPLVSLVTGADGAPDNVAYFWLTGILSSFLDNAPTYLVFFEMAGGDPQVLMTTLSQTLLAISAGAVFMGANTYIGNAPNFMVYAIARGQGIAMPSFFGYMLWSLAVLVPVFALASLLFFL
ncbi:sodium:proton antiporter [Mesorhizobium sp. CAU 1741]|uniref:sodium:proton antiporter n=1 Tax=Mesorhizobium sp. CAU 1741 TaxID=3140366 RepID=UPI00325C27C3